MIALFLSILPALFCLVLSFSSLPLIYMPITEIEQRLWQKLKIRTIRHWVTRKGTEKWAQKSTIHNAAERSRSNIAWHGLFTFIFGTLIIRAQFVHTQLIQYGSYVLVIPSLAYFLGSVVQRQKLVIIMIRKKCALPTAGKS
jgi:hypothetical protein